MQMQFINGMIHTADKLLKNGNVLVQEGLILEVNGNIREGIDTIDLKEKHLSAGFIDIQINGGEQFYFSENPSAAVLEDVYESSARHGATHILPCLISSPREKILEGIETVRHFKESHPGVVGMHLEGPFINPEKRGAHSKDIIRKPTMAELEEIVRYGKEVIKIITIAPEMFSTEQLQFLQETGIVISAGHSNMNFEQADFYFKNGISLVTHLYNAMTQMAHREPGIVGAVFENSNVYAPIILDGAHCHYAAAKIAYNIKKDKLILLSDAAFLGRKRKSFQSSLLDATLKDGFYRNSDGNLAGAAISMTEAVCNAVNHVGIPINEAVQMATNRVAKAIRMEGQIGEIAPGYPASFVCFNDDLTGFETLRY